MSGVSGEKRKMNTPEVEQNKKPRLDPEAGQGARTDAHHHQQQGHSHYMRTGVGQDAYSASYRSTQNPPVPVQSLDEQDEAELRELQEAQRQRRMLEARQRASQQAQRAQDSGATQQSLGYSAAQSPSLPRGTSSQGLGGNRTSTSLYGHLPRQTRPAVNLSTKPGVPSHGSSSFTTQGAFQPRPSLRQAPVSPYASAPATDLTSERAQYYTDTYSGKPDGNTWTPLNQSSGTENHRQTQRKAKKNDLPVLPSASSANAYYHSQVHQEDQLPSSDGLDLLEFGLSYKGSGLPQQGGSQSVHAINTDDPFSLLSAFDTEGGTTRSDNSFSEDPWDTAYSPLPGHDQLHRHYPLSGAELRAQVDALMREHPIDNWAAAETNARSTNPYWSLQSKTTHGLGKRSRNNSNSPEPGVKGEGTSDVESEEPIPKRQKRIRRLKNEGKEMGRDSKVKGKVDFDVHGNMYCLINGNKHLAAYHYKRRHVLLEIADRLGKYRYPSERGAADDDRMAYHPAYANFNMKARDGRPDILYQWEPTKQKPIVQEPGFMRDPIDNKILLDVDNHPIRDWPELPATISGQVEGIWIEYWHRTNPSITKPDIVARCPKTTQKHASSKEHELTIAAYGNRARRDRVLIGTHAWDAREGSKQISDKLKSLMPKRVLAQIESHNSTKSWRDLTNEEVDMVLTVNKSKGSALSRAGNKRLDEDKKKERENALKPRTEAVQRRMEAEKQQEDAEYERLLAQREVDTKIWKPISTGGNQKYESPAHELSSFVQAADSRHQNCSQNDYRMPATEIQGTSSATVPHKGAYTDELEGTTLIEDTINPTVPETDTKGPVDYSTQIPNAMEEFESVDNALQITRDEYRNLLGQKPPPPSNPFGVSYHDQWAELQNSFNEHWQRARPGIVPISLPKRVDWTGSWDAWTTATVTRTGNDCPGASNSTNTGNFQTRTIQKIQAPVTSAEGSSVNDLFKDHDEETIVDLGASAQVGGKVTPEKPHLDVTDEDAPAYEDDEPRPFSVDSQNGYSATEYPPTFRDNHPETGGHIAAPSYPENNFDRMIREMENENKKRKYPFDFTQFTSEDAGRLDAVLNNGAEGSGTVSLSDVENSNGGHDTQVLQQEAPEVQSNILSTSDSQGPSSSTPPPQNKDLLSADADRQGTRSRLENQYGDEQWEIEAWEGRDISNEEIEKLFDSMSA